MLNRDDFAIFILTHGRADDVVTAHTLKAYGYTGRWYIVIDNEDSQEARYRELYGDKVLQFDKLAISKTFDTFDNREERRTVVFARNACFELAKQIGVRYFLELDDDYDSFCYRWIEGKKLKAHKVNDFNSLINEMIQFLDCSGALSICFAQGGDFIGGALNKRFRQGLMRKAMNSFFCDVERPFQFIGRINEDVNTYTLLGSRGQLFFTVNAIVLTQRETQAGAGGMTNVYVDSGTFVKSFYTVICMPSAVKVSIMGRTNMRMHHRVYWDKCVPQIISERWRKQRG